MSSHNCLLLTDFHPPFFNSVLINKKNKMTVFKIYFLSERTLKGERCTNVTFLEMDNIKDATLYAMKTFGDDFIEIIER